MPPTRRERQRTATVADIKEAAWQQVAEVGAPALSLRGVARAIGMSPAGLYRYYDGLDALLTALLVDAYEDLADTVQTAIDGEPDGCFEAAFLAGVEAYRGWAITHPNRFLLIFGTPVPGYVAPEDGPTVQANARMGQAFMVLGARAWAAGALSPPATHAEDDGPRSPRAIEVIGQLRQIAPDLPAPMIDRMVSMWAHWHGLVILEVTNQLDWIHPDAAPFFRREARRMAHDFGIRDRATAV